MTRLFACSCLFFAVFAAACSREPPQPTISTGPDAAADAAGADADAAAAADVAAAADLAVTVDTAASDAAPPDAQADAVDASAAVDAADTADAAASADAADAADTDQPDGGLLPGQCPIADLVVKEGWEVIPQTTLHLKGDGSQAASDTTIAKYQWTVAQQPTGSFQPLLPSDSVPNPTMQANAAGKYEFCLTVWDAKGKQACNKACVDVQVVPSIALHIELLWDTPADPDQTDCGPASGADMDLHFAHPPVSPAGPDLDCDGAPDPWFTNPWDCFWFNMNPNWGSSNPAVADDPSLDLDDTCGAGPENLNLISPEGTLDDPIAYSVGAHYWNDHGYGKSFAILNIWVQGMLAVQLGKVAMDPLDMWYVGKIHWPNQMTGGTLPLFQTCYQSADACSAGGKLWQAAGDWCMTKCYYNKSFTASAGVALPPACKKP